MDVWYTGRKYLWPCVARISNGALSQKNLGKIVRINSIEGSTKIYLIYPGHSITKDGH